MNGLFRRLYREGEPDPTAADPPADPPADPKNGPEGKGDKGTTNPPLIFGRFKTLEEAEKGYREAQSQLGKLTNEVKELKGGGGGGRKRNEKGQFEPAAGKEQEGLTIPDEPETDPSAPSTLDFKSMLSEAGLDDPKKLNEQWATGSLTDDQYKVFESKGIGREWVNEFLAGQHARAQLISQQRAQIKEQTFKMLGGGDVGQKRWQTLQSFAAKLPGGRKADLRERLGDINRFNGAVRELVDEYNQANGFTGSKALMVGSGSGGPSNAMGGGKPFTSRVEMTNAAKEARRKHGGRSGSEWNDPEFAARARATNVNELTS